MTSSRFPVFSSVWLGAALLIIGLALPREAKAQLVNWFEWADGSVVNFRVNTGSFYSPPGGVPALPANSEYAVIRAAQVYFQHAHPNVSFVYKGTTSCIHEECGCPHDPYVYYNHGGTGGTSAISPSCWDGTKFTSFRIWIDPQENWLSAVSVDHTRQAA